MTGEVQEAEWPSLDGVTDVSERRRILGEHVRLHPEVIDELAAQSIQAGAVEDGEITSAAWNDNLR